MRFFKLGQLNSGLAGKVFWYTIGILGLKKTDVILTSFPKSGNTWVRFFFCNLISLEEWQGKVVDFSVLDSTMPELGVNNLLSRWPYLTIPRIVKTHRQYLPFFRHHKIIMIIRDPRDVMVSLYHYRLGKKSHKSAVSFSEFIRDPDSGLKSWFRYHASWQSIDKEIFRYEDIKKDDVSEFQRMLGYLELSISQEIIEKAAERSCFKNIRQIEKAYGHSKPNDNKDHFTFARKGSSGDWRETFSNSDLEYFKSLCDKYEFDMYAE